MTDDELHAYAERIWRAMYREIGPGVGTHAISEKAAEDLVRVIADMISNSVGIYEVTKDGAMRRVEITEFYRLSEK